MSWTTFRDEVEQELQDAGNVEYGTDELDIQMRDALRKISEYEPDRDSVVLELESRTGVATSTSAGNLVDATEQQFVWPADGGKWVYNVTDRTWTTINAFTSTSQVGLDEDIFVKDDVYAIFNKGCRSRIQLNLEDIKSYVGPSHLHGVKEIYFPHDSVNRTRRNMKDPGVVNDILTLDIDFEPNDSKEQDAVIEVELVLNRPHFITELTLTATDLVNGAESAGATSMDVNGMSGAEVIRVGQPFTLADVMGVYRVTKEVTLSGGATSSNGLEFFPPAENAIADDAVVTFIESTLTPRLERMAVEMAAAGAAKSKAAAYFRRLRFATRDANDMDMALNLSRSQIQQGIADLSSGRTQSNLMDEVILLINAEVDKLDPVIKQARGQLGRGSAETAQINVAGGNVPGTRASTAVALLRAAEAHRQTAMGYRDQVSGQDEQSRSFANLALSQIEAGLGTTQRALGLARAAETNIAISNSARDISSWARDKERTVLEDLEGQLVPNQIFDHYTGR